jgi:phosphoribosylaminoimidazolecarboxamide formyltransferase/IMP cyclohydrolase
LGGTLLQGKELSYNNILDLDSALRSVQSFEKATVSIVKHNSPCGLASANNLSDAFKAALACDPISAFGSVIACNRAIDEEFVLALDNLFIECLTAPHFSNAALKLLALRKNCRLLQISSTQKEPFEWRSISNGFLRQQRDYGGPSKSSWQLMTKRKASAELLESLSFAWNVVAHVKSNAIVLAQGEATVGIGGGQPNRIDCLRIAASRAKLQTHGAVMASDAFFPFADSIAEAKRIGIAAIIQPGGGMRDAEVIQAAEDANIAMIFTGTRHFRH